MWRIVIVFLIFCVLATAMMVLINYNQMAEQKSVRPWEEPMLQPAPGAVAVSSDDRLQLSREQSMTLVNDVPNDPASVLRGERAYRGFCLPCHGANLDGYGPVGPSLPGPMRALDAPEVAARPDGELFWIIRHRVNAHPPIGTSMRTESIWDTINYLRSKQQTANR